LPIIIVCLSVVHEMHTVNIGVEVRTAVTIKSVVFWDVTPCSLIGVHRRYAVMYCLYIQGRRVSQENSKKQVLVAFSPEEGCSPFLRIADNPQPDYTAAQAALAPDHANSSPANLWPSTRPTQ
jgi:hypothetical protein